MYYRCLRTSQRPFPVKTQSGRIPEALAQQAAAGASAAQIADSVVATWRNIDAALSPIIGHGSVAVLYMRSLHLIVPGHRWLADIQQSLPATVDLDALKSAVSQQSSQVAAAAGGALLQSFYELLASLVGPSLTEQLLRSVWNSSHSASPAQDTSP